MLIQVREKDLMTYEFKGISRNLVKIFTYKIIAS
jgi:hypothetical protein